jgi:hypothetical protein
MKSASIEDSTNELQLTACFDRYTSPADNDDLFTQAHELPQPGETTHGLVDALKRSPHLSGPLFGLVLLVDRPLSDSRPF